MSPQVETAYVELKAETPKRLVIDRWNKEDRLVTDPATKQQVKKPAWVFHVVQEDGQVVDKTFSTLSKKLKDTLSPLIDNGQLFSRMVEIVWRPRGYATEYEVRVV